MVKMVTRPLQVILGGKVFNLVEKGSCSALLVKMVTRPLYMLKLAYEYQGTQSSRC